MKKMYISDLIKEKDIKGWNSGVDIMITAPTGSGKSTIIMGGDNIYGLNDYALEQGKKILFLTNRDLLKGQFKEIIKANGSSNIKLMNYQAIESLLLDKANMQDFKKYDYIVIDECHYFFNDSTFNETTDLSLKWILEQDEKTRIFMSATSSSITRYLENNIKLDLLKYEVERDYSYIDNLFFYEDDQVLKKMLLELPKSEKAIYFSGAGKAYTMSKELNDAVFYCSQYNTKYNEFRDMDVYEQIKTESKFNNQILCTTTVMDNSVSILDDEVKHIIVDVFDIDTIVQCLGRKRLNYEEKINVYIKNYTGTQINGKISHTQNGLFFADVLKKYGQNYLVDEYPRKYYGKTIFEELEGTVEDGKLIKKVNEIMYIKFLSTIKFCEELLENKRTNEQYSMYVSNLLQMNYEKIQLLESYFDAVTIENVIDVNFIDKKLFDKEQQDISDIIIKELISVKGVDYRTKKLKPSTLENILRIQLNLPYAVESKQESKGENRGMRYIIITKLK